MKDGLLFGIVSNNFVDLISNLSFLNFSFATFPLKVAPVTRFLIRIPLPSKGFSFSFTYVTSCLTHCKSVFVHCLENSWCKEYPSSLFDPGHLSEKVSIVGFFMLNEVPFADCCFSTPDSNNPRCTFSWLVVFRFKSLIHWYST